MPINENPLLDNSSKLSPYGDTPIEKNPYGDTPVSLPITEHPEQNPNYDFEPVTPNDEGYGQPDPSVLINPAAGLPGTSVTKQNSEATKQKQFKEIKDAERYAAQDFLGARVNLDKSLDDFNLSADLARSDKLDEQLDKVAAKYPDADVKKVPQANGERLFIRLKGAKEYIPVEPVSIFDSSKDYASKAGTVVGSLVNAENAVSTAGALATGGSGLVPRLATAAASSGIGRFIDMGLEWLRGYQKDSTGDMASDVAGSMATGAAGEAVGSAVQGLRNIKRGVTNTASFDSQLVDASKRVLYPDAQGNMQEFPVSADMLVPQLKRMMNQFRQLGFKGARDQETNQKVAVLYNLDKMRREGTQTGKDFLDSENLDNLTNNLEKRTYQESGLAMPTNDPNYKETGGRNIISSLTAYKDVGKKQIGEVYDGLFSSMPKGAQIDLTGVQQTIRDSLKPVKFEGKPKIQEIDIGTGTPLKQEIATEESFGKDISPKFRNLLDKMQNIKEDVTTYKGQNAFERIKQLRSMVADVAFPVDNSVVTAPADQQVARSVYNQLTDAMEKVTFPNGTDPNFISAWQEANRTNKMFNDFFEQPHIKEVMNYSEPTQVLQKINPGNTAFIKDLKSSMPADDFEQNVSNVFKQNLYENPGKIIQTLDGFAGQSDVLNMLIPKQEQQAYRQLGRQWEKMNNSKVYSWMKTYGTMAERASELAQTSPEELARYIEVDPSGMFKKVVSMGFATNAIEDAIKYSNGQRILDPQKALANLNLLDTKGFLSTKYMTLEDIERIQDLRTVLSGMTGSAGDSGASLEAASDIAQITDITRLFHSPGAYLSDATSLFAKSNISRALTSDTAQKLFKAVGSGKTNLPYDKLPVTRAGIIAATNMMQDIGLDAEEKSGPKPVFDITKHPDMTLEDLQTLTGIYNIPESAFKKAMQNQNLRDMENSIKKTTTQPEVKGGSGDDTFEYDTYASLDDSGSFSPTSEQDKLRYMEEDAFDKPKSTPKPVAPRQTQKPMVAHSDTELKAMLSHMSKTIGMNEKLLEKIATAESSFGKNTQAATSSARGLFQFTKGTWKELVNKYGQRAGISEADIDDPKANSLMGALYMYDNLTALKKRIGRQPTDAEAYATHFLGLDGATKLVDNYKSNPIAKDIFKSAAQANPSIFYHTDEKGKPLLNKPRTVRQVYHVLQTKID